MIWRHFSNSTGPFRSWLIWLKCIVNDDKWANDTPSLQNGSSLVHSHKHQMMDWKACETTDLSRGILFFLAFYPRCCLYQADESLSLTLRTGGHHLLKSEAVALFSWKSVNTNRLSRMGQHFDDNLLVSSPKQQFYTIMHMQRLQQRPLYQTLYVLHTYFRINL